MDAVRTPTAAGTEATSRPRTPVGFDQLHESVLPFVSREISALREDWSVQHARDVLRASTTAQDILYFYVLDQDRRLRGVVPTRSLLLADRELTVRDIMADDVIAIPAWATVLVACEYFVNRRFLAFPVVEDDGTLLGTVDVGMFAPEVLDLAKRNFDDVFQIIGVHATESRTPWLAFKDRFPWLLSNIAGGILCALLSSRYEGLLEVAVVLALFVPVVLALAESVSIQSVTLTLQSLQGGPLNWRRLGRSFARELQVALMLGASCGTLVGLVVVIWKGAWQTGVAVGGAITASMATASLLGLLIPTSLHAFEADPKIAAGPIVLALADIATLLFYFNLAGLLLAR